MKFLFFDMEFANGQVPGSIYSVGYLVTDEEFRILESAVDILINPECEWNAYVEENILAYPKDTVEAAPVFPQVYSRIQDVFEDVDVAVGFSVSNDNRALKKDCERYGMKPFSYRWFDVEKLCRMMDEHKDAHGLGGYYTAWCGGEQKNAHRSDGDAVATMELLRAMCQAKHVTADMMLEAYPECVGTVTANPPQVPPKADGGRKHRRRRRSRRAGGKASAKEAAPLPESV